MDRVEMTVVFTVTKDSPSLMKFTTEELIQEAITGIETRLKYHEPVIVEATIRDEEQPVE